MPPNLCNVTVALRDVRQFVCEQPAADMRIGVIAPCGEADMMLQGESARFNRAGGVGGGRVGMDADIGEARAEARLELRAHGRVERRTTHAQGGRDRGRSAIDRRTVARLALDLLLFVARRAFAAERGRGAGYERALAPHHPIRRKFGLALGGIAGLAQAERREAVMRGCKRLRAERALCARKIAIDITRASRRLIAPAFGDALDRAGTAAAHARRGRAAWGPTRTGIRGIMSIDCSMLSDT